jgi:ribosome-binding factor A
MRYSYQRSDRVSILLKEEISQLILREVKDPELGFVTITDVEVSKDLQVAKVYYTVLGNTQQKHDSSHTLQRVAHFIKRQLGKRLRMRSIPDIIFKYDHSLDYGEKIDSLLRRVHSNDTIESNDK